MVKAKIWTDASCFAGGQESYIAIIVTVRNDIIAQFTERLATGASLHAEFFAVIRAAEIAAMLRLSSVQICCDHSTAVGYAQKGQPKIAAVEELQALQAHLSELIPLFDTFSVIHIPRKGNRAHAIAHKLLRDAPVSGKLDYFSPIIPGLQRRGNDNSPTVEGEQREVEEDDAHDD